jgi:hypothetical protein
VQIVSEVLEGGGVFGGDGEGSASAECFVGGLFGSEGCKEGGVPKVATVTSGRVMARSRQGPSTAAGMTTAAEAARLMRDLQARAKTSEE